MLRITILQKSQKKKKEKKKRLISIEHVTILID